MMTRDHWTVGAIPRACTKVLLASTAALTLGACTTGGAPWTDPATPSAQEVAGQASGQTHKDDVDVLVLYSTNIAEDHAQPTTPDAQPAAGDAPGSAPGTDQPDDPADSDEMDEPDASDSQEDLPGAPGPEDAKKRINSEIK